MFHQFQWSLAQKLYMLMATVAKSEIFLLFFA